MSLNKTLSRISAIIQAHKQVRSYEQAGLTVDLENQHTRKYPVVTLIVQPFGISFNNKTTTYSLTLGFFDLVHQAQDAKTNEWDVVSDMMGIAEDIFAQIKNPEYSDWKVTSDNTLRPVFEGGGDMFAGVELDLSISTMFKADICQVPSDLIIDITDTDMSKPTYVFNYTATGNEATTLLLETLAGKNILLVVREMAVLHRVSNLPDPAEYTWDDTQLGLGSATNLNERFLIQYRNY